MRERVLCFLLACLLVLLSLPAGMASESGASDTAAKVKAEVMRLGPHAPVRVRLLDGTEIRGRIGEIGARSFVVQDEKRGDKQTVSYSEVKQVKKSGLSTGAKIAIGIGIAAAVAIAGVVLADGDDQRPESPCRAVVGQPCPPGCICKAQ